MVAYIWALGTMLCQSVLTNDAYDDVATCADVIQTLGSCFAVSTRVFSVRAAVSSHSSSELTTVFRENG